MNRLIDLKTFAEVASAAPVLPGLDPETAEDVISAIQNLNVVMEWHTDALGRQYRQAPYALIVTEMESPIEPALLGRIARQLGLYSKRFADGYHLFWNEEQLKILAAYYSLIPEA